jgi:DNA polymerase III gamma/tau subunit
MAKYEPSALGESVPPHYRQQYQAEAPHYSEAFLLHGIDLLLEGERRQQYTRSPEIALEATLLKIALLPLALQSESLSSPTSPPPSSPSSPPSPKARTGITRTSVPQSLDEVKKKPLNLPNERN